MKKSVLFLTAIAIMSFVMLFTVAYAAQIEPDNIVYRNGNEQIFTIEAGSLTSEVTLTSDTAYSSARLITAVYSGNVLDKVDFKTVSIAEATQTVKSNAVKVETADSTILKAMLWNENLEPIMPAQLLSSKSCDTRITAFEIADATAVDINEEDKLITVEYSQPYNQQNSYIYPSRAGVTPSITSAGSVVPSSGTAVDLSLKEPITYTVTAEDGSQAEYKVIAENTVTRCQTAFDGTYSAGESGMIKQTDAVVSGAGVMFLGKGNSGTLEAVNNPFASETNQVLHFVDSNTSGATPSIYFEDRTAGTQPVKFSMEFKVYIDELPAGKSAPVYVKLGKTAKQLSFSTSTGYTGSLGDYDFGFCLADGAPTTDGKSCLYKGYFDRWYTVRYVLEQRDGAVYSTLYINGVYIGQQKTINSSWILQGDVIFRVACDSSSTGSDFYIDDYRLTVQATEPLAKVNLVGDSITWSYSASYENQQGWGHYFADSLDSTKTVYTNFSYPGWDTDSYLNPVDETKPTWAKVMAQTESGDYVVIALGANDCYDARAEDVFKANLCTLIDDTSAKGATPVLVTPHVTAEAYENGSFSNRFGAYAEYIKDVANEKGVVCLDLNTVMLTDLNTKMASDEFTLDTIRTEYYSCKNGTDFVHLNPTGAQYICDMVCELLRTEDSCRLNDLLLAQ